MRAPCTFLRPMCVSILLVLAACTEALGTLGRPVNLIALTPAAASITPGSTLPVAALALDVDGYPLPDRAITWTSSDPAVATVTSTSVVTGVVTGLTAGTATITAASEGHSNTAIVTVVPQSIDTIVVAPVSASVTVGQTLQLSAVAKDVAGGVLEGRNIAWSSSNSSIATVSSTGLVTAIAAGITGITASGGGEQTTATITVLAPVTAPVASVVVTPSTAGVLVGQAVQLTATPLDAGGVPLTGRTVTWASSNLSIATVSSNGLVSGIATGVATITAVSETAQGLSTVTVTSPTANTSPATVANLTATSSTDRSVTLSFTEVSDGLGLPASYDVRFMPAPFSWGQAKPVTQGTCSTPMAGTAVGAQRSCTVEGLSASTSYQFQLVAFRGTLNVNAVFGSLSNVANGATTGSTAPVASVMVTPTAVTLGIGATQQFAAVLRDADGNLLTGRTISWSSSNPLVASVGSSGLVTTLAEGTATISAISEGKTGTASATVTTTAASLWPNEPVGFTVVRDAPWNTVPPSGWSAAYNEDQLATVVADASAPHSPSNVLQFRYPQGFVGGSAPATIYAANLDAKEYFVGLWWKPSSPWHGHPSSINKILFFYTASRADVVATMYGPNGGPYHVRVVTQGMPSSGTYLTQNVNVVPVVLGKWHRIEMYLKYDSYYGAGDGVIRWWVNGILVGNHVGLSFPNDAGFREFQLSPTWGGISASKAQQDYFWYDHVYLSRR